MGFLSKLFGGKAPSDTPMNEETVQQIIQAYGAALEKQAPTPGCVADVGKLPFPKQKIKEALLIGLKVTNDQHMREMLKFSYINLIYWQEGVGDKDQGLDLSNINLNDDTMKIADQVLAQSAGHEKWSPIVLAELEALKKELQSLGL